MKTKYSARVKKALKKISYSKVLDVYECRDYVEITVNNCGDVLQFRIYNDGKVCER